MTATYVIFGITASLFGASAVAALAWSFGRGQWADFHRGAASIFDADEPIGRPTDMRLGKPGTPAPTTATRGDRP